jgi:hypothetical protein
MSEGVEGAVPSSRKNPFYGLRKRPGLTPQASGRAKDAPGVEGDEIDVSQIEKRLR